MDIRTANENDAESACYIVRRSIKELCFADHQNDAQAIQGWLANKTP